MKIELFNDHFQNYKVYGIPKAQLVIADIPYNLGNNAYASSPQWYIDGDNKNGESKLANKEFFDTDKDFRIAEFMHFCSKMLKPEPKETNKAPAMIVFCAFEQMQMVIEYGKKYGFMKSYPLVFIKNYSSQVLKANMKIVGATEYAVVLYRDKLPKFNNGKKEGESGKMIFNWFEWKRDSKNEYPKIHPTQKPVNLLKRLIEVFTDEGDIVIDPVAGSCTTLRACAELNRSCYGFEIKKNFCKDAKRANVELCKNGSEISDTRHRPNAISFIRGVAMWKVDQIMANAEKETEKGYKIYSYYIRQLQDSEVTYTAEYEEYKQKLVELFIDCKKMEQHSRTSIGSDI